MSWWWMAPLGVSAAAAVLLGLVARRLREESARTARRAAGLAETLARLSETPQRLRVDVDRYHPTETTPRSR
jgi:hypothetical protein